MKLFRILFLILFLNVVLLVALLESNPGKRLAQNFLLNALTKSGLQVKVGSLSGNLPYQIHLEQIQFDGIELDKADLEISVIYLLKRELYIKKLTAQGLHFTEQNKTISTRAPITYLPLSVTVHSFHIEGDLTLDGEASIRRSGAGHFDVAIRRADIPDAKLTASASWDRNQSTEASLYVTTPTLTAFAPWIILPAEGSLELEGYANGTFDDYSGKLSSQFNAKKLPFDLPDQNEWAVKSHFRKTKEMPLQFQQILIASKQYRFQGSVNFDSHYKLAVVDGQIRAEIPQGLVFATGKIAQGQNGFDAKLLLSSDHLNIEGQIFEKSLASIKGILTPDAFIGSTQLNTRYLQEDWEATSSLAFRPDTSLLFEDIQIQSTLATANGNLALRMPENTFVGKFNIEQGDLQLLHRLHLLPLMYGTASGVFAFDDTGIYTDIKGKEIHYQSSYIGQASFYRDSTQLNVGASQVQWKNASLDTVSFNWTGTEFSGSATGTLKDPLNFEMKGVLQADQGIWQGTLASVHGTLLKQHLSLTQPAAFSFGQENRTIAPLQFELGQGTISFDYNQTPTKTDTALIVTKVPLDLLSLNPLEVPISGDFYFNGSLHEENGQSLGHVKGRLDNGVVAVEGKPNPIAIYGDWEATLEKGQLKGNTHIFVNHAPYLSLDCEIPLTLETKPFAIHLLQDKSLDGQISLHGNLEEITDFFNFGTHRIEGRIDCEMKVKGSLSRPRLKGTCEITEGRYQNYITGTELTGLHGTLEGEGNKLILSSFSGYDLKCGVCTATGQIKLSASDYFPFTFDAQFAQLGLLQLDLITADAFGKVSITGDIRSATATGSVQVHNCDITIPDKIPRTFPELQVVYKNAPYLSSLKKPKTETPYPLNLDLEVSSPKSIFINGRGLTSEWNGNFSIGGTYTSPSVKGKLELVQGEFIFAGKQFKLIEGSVSMHGQSYETPQVDIAANTTENGISITARIKGPINTPQITFQSSPPMPLSAILSYLIFGKDLSEVSGLQALQLASTIATVAGEGPDILEMTRKSLGVDRLQIVMTPSSLEEGADTISLEIGKIIFPGFLVAVRQGAEDSAPNVSIEVDLTHGFTLGLESQQQLEQGKFSLNWNINY